MTNKITKTKNAIFTTATAVVMAGMIGTTVFFCGCNSNQNASETSAATQAVTQAPTEAETVAPTAAAPTTAAPIAATPAATVAPVTAAPAQNNANGAVTLEEAVNIALKDAGFTAADVNFTKKAQDTDDGVQKYEIEFTNGGYEYDYDINASTGQIIEKSKEAVND